MCHKKHLMVFALSRRDGGLMECDVGRSFERFTLEWAL